MIQVANTGRNPTMRHLGRTHRCSVSWIHERFASDDLELIKEPSETMAADIFTKAFTNPEKWDSVRRLINVVPPEDKFWEPEYEPKPLTEEERQAIKAKKGKNKAVEPAPEDDTPQGGGNDWNDSAPAMPARVSSDGTDRVDITTLKYASTFTTNRSADIPWRFVSRRVTTDLDSGKILADETDVQSMTSRQ